MTQNTVVVTKIKKESIEEMIPDSSNERVVLDSHPVSNGEYGVCSTPSFKNPRVENLSTFPFHWIPLVGDADTNWDALEIN